MRGSTCCLLRLVLNIAVYSTWLPALCHAYCSYCSSSSFASEFLPRIASRHVFTPGRISTPIHPETSFCGDFNRHFFLLHLQIQDERRHISDEHEISFSMTDDACFMCQCCVQQATHELNRNQWHGARTEVRCGSNPPLTFSRALPSLPLRVSCQHANCI